MPDALPVVFPAATLQICIVHLIRNKTWNLRAGKTGKGSLPRFDRSTRRLAEADETALGAFIGGPWRQRFPTIGTAWKRAWDRVIPFFAFPRAMRKAVYTTNSIESVNAQLRKIIKMREYFPSDDAAAKLIWLALRNMTAEWSRVAHGRKTAINQFAIRYEDRFSKPLV